MRAAFRWTDSPAHTRPVALFAVAVGALWLAQLLAVLAGARPDPDGVNVLTRLWIAGYAVFSFNTCLNFALNLVGVWSRAPKLLPELPAPPAATVAVVCPIYREDPDLLFVRLDAIIRGNAAPGRVFWVLSDSPAAESAELAMIERLRGQWPTVAIHYRCRPVNTDYKSGNLAEFLYCQGGFGFEYLVILDSDSYLPAGTISRLLAKAAHPANERVFLFQTRLSIYHARTRWARYQKTGVEIGSRLHLPALFRGQAVSWGHNCLVRTEVLRRMYEYADAPGGLRRPLPTRERSHDVFDFLYGSMLGYSAQFVADIETFEEAPATAGVSAARQERWARGSLSATKLIFEPAASFYARFLVWLGSMSFLNSTFLLWFLLSLWLAAHPAQMDLYFANDCALGPVLANRTLLVVSVLSLFTYFGFPLFAASRTLPLHRIAGHMLLSNLILFSQLTSGFLVLLRALFTRPGAWTPTALIASDARGAALASLPCVAVSAFAAHQLWQLGHLAWWVFFATPVVIGGLVAPLLVLYLDRPSHVA